MHLTHLELHQFRSYAHLDLAIDPVGLRLFGDNASGKSTVLEAIMLLASTKSPRSSAEREMVRWGSGEEYGVPPFARVVGQVDRLDGPVAVEIALAADPERLTTVRKTIKVNGRPARASDTVGRLKAVLFSPEDVALISGSPSGRRRYLDLMISQLSGEYLQALSRYLRVVEQRNSLLKSLQRDGVAPNSALASGQLAFWDEQFLALGSLVMAYREATIRKLGRGTAEKYHLLTGEEQFRLSYLPSIDTSLGSDPDISQEIPELQMRLHRALQAEVAARRVEEVRRGVSVVGPHRDDLGFLLGEVDIGTFGSRGQQRLAVVALKLAECSHMADLSGEPPLLLLDDVLSELDARHRSLLEVELDRLRPQMFVTGTHADEWSGSIVERLPVARVVAGTITSA